MLCNIEIRTIPLVRFPHVASRMPASFQYGIVTSQVIRFQRICTFANDFVEETARLLAILHHNKSYSQRRLLLCARRALSRFPSLYGSHSFIGIFDRVVLVYKQFLASGVYLLRCV